ncbi:MAG TPA: pilus assembly protein N-terminal domain-containing protein [Terriglobales bacterium]|nr:pilus assembly protein N-terminal domain-containing protein [Terriglobales bacterium]
MKKFVLSILLLLTLLPGLRAQTPTTPAPTQEPNVPVPAGVQQESEPSQRVPLRVRVNKSLLINTQTRLRRVSVTDPTIADALVVSPTQVLIHGRAPGEVSLLLWDETDRSRSFDLRVDVDVTAANEELGRIMKDEKIDVSASRSAIVLSGHVSSKEVAEHAGMIASAYSKNVVNVLTFGPVGAQAVLLEVRFAEVNRVALTQLGINFLSTGAGNTPGTVSTGQFGPPPPVDLTGVIGAPTGGFTTSIPGIEVLNIFFFRPDLNLGATIRALQQKNVLQVLAEPNLIAVNGKEASFLAGGEFPVPIVQGTGISQAISVQFKEFGVRLSFIPVIMPNGNIHLTVKPEVSALDFANGVRLGGFQIPALSTRRAATELEMRDGQSFVIAGLMDNRIGDEMSKIPFLGDIPILGNFFKSKSLRKTNNELMVLVTARRISPSDQPPPLLAMPKQGINKEDFDKGKRGGIMP